MGMLVGQLIKILEQLDQDREVMIHTLSGETVEVRGYFVQLIKILEQLDQDREVMIHTLSGETVEVRGYFVQKDIDDNSFYITDLDVVPR